MEGGAGEEGSGGSNDSNINGDDTLFDCDTEAPINSPLATAMDKATGSDGKVGTPSFAREIPRINIGAGEGQGTIRFAFVNNRMEILRSPPATTSPPATKQLRRQDAVLTPPSATSPRSGKINPPDLAGPVPRKLHHKNDRQDCESSNTSPPELAAALTQAPPFGNSWPVDATGRTHPSNFAGPPVREENSSISQATETSRELSANLRKQAQTSQIELAEWGDHLGVVPIQEQLDELESERLRRMRERSDIIRMGQAFGVVSTHEELDPEERERLLRMRFVEREQKRREARSIAAATGQSARREVKNTVASTNVKDAYEPGEDLDKNNNHEEQEGLAVDEDGTEKEERKLTKEQVKQEEIGCSFYLQKRNELMEKLATQPGVEPMISFEHCNACRTIWIGMESTFALPLTEELRLEYERFFRQNPESVIDTILRGTGVDMRSIGGCGALSYWDTEMLQMYITFIMHELHPSRVQVGFWMGEVDLGNNVVGNFLKPETEFYIVCATLLDKQHFCHYLFDLKKLVCHIVDPDKSNTLDDHKVVR